MRMVTVAAVQMHCSRDVTDNLERAEQLVRQAVFSSKVIGGFTFHSPQFLGCE